MKKKNAISQGPSIRVNERQLQGTRFTKAEAAVDTVNGACQGLMDKQWRSKTKTEASVVSGHHACPFSGRETRDK